MAVGLWKPSSERIVSWMTRGMLPPLLLPLLLSLLTPLPLVAVPGGDGPVPASPPSRSSPLLATTNLWTIRLSFSTGSWAALAPDEKARRGPPPRRPGWGPPPGGPGRLGVEFPWTHCRVEWDGEALETVAVRYKGNSSFGMSGDGLKKPFKLDFNRGAPGRSFRGIDKLSLNNNFNDATQLREAVAFEACRAAGLPAPRTAFARLYLSVQGERTNEYLGLYTLVEGVEGRFLKEHFKTKKGLLLKPDRLRTLEYLGEGWESYTNRYQPKEAVPAGEERRFIALTRLIAQADDATLASELPARLDLENFFRYVAVTALLANYDSFIGNGHNYYFFQPAGGGKGAFIPWDFNEAFGGHPMAGTRRDQAGWSILHPSAGENRLVDRVLANPEWAARYRRLVESLLVGACRPDRLQASAARLAAIVQEAAFDESAVAKAQFQRIALGQLSIPAPRRSRGDFPPGPPPDRPPGPPPPPGGPPPFGPGAREDLPLADWITLRSRNLTEELAGNRDAPSPRMRRPF